MVACREQAVAFLRAKLRPVPSVAKKRIEQLVHQLDDDRFPSREAASSALEQLNDLATSTLRQTLSGTVSLETRRRIERILENVERRPLPPQRRRALRAIEILAQIDNAGAHELLAMLAAGAPAAIETRQAHAVLQHRLEGLENKLAE
jgi:hypothetical protein